MEAINADNADTLPFPAFPSSPPPVQSGKGLSSSPESDLFVPSCQLRSPQHLKMGERAQTSTVRNGVYLIE